MFSKKNKALLQIHFAVILFGVTAILGDLINLSALMIVWWRVLITSISLLFFIKWGKELLKLSKKEILIFLGIGVIIALHWLSFYGAVKLSNASITLICMATTSLFTSIIEPLYFKRRLNWIDVMLGVLIIPCMILVVNGVSESYYIGIIVGLFAAFTASLFSVINKDYVDKVNIMSMTFVEMIGVFIFLSIIMPFVFEYSDQVYTFFPPTSMDWVYIGILSILCTTVAWVISLIALRVLSVFEANLVVNLEPVYGMVLAAVILKEHEQLNITFYIGAAMILVIVLMYPYIKRRQSKSIANG